MATMSISFASLSSFVKKDNKSMKNGKNDCNSSHVQKVTHNLAVNIFLLHQLLFDKKKRCDNLFLHIQMTKCHKKYNKNNFSNRSDTFFCSVSLKNVHK